MQRAFQPECRFNDRGDWHFADAAEALGGDGMRVWTRSDLGRALEHAATMRGRFQLVEAMIPTGVYSNTLDRFVAGLQRTRRPAARG